MNPSFFDIVKKGYDIDQVNNFLKTQNENAAGAKENTDREIKQLNSQSELLRERAAAEILKNEKAEAEISKLNEKIEEKDALIEELEDKIYKLEQTAALYAEMKEKLDKIESAKPEKPRKKGKKPGFWRSVFER